MLVNKKELETELKKAVKFSDTKDRSSLTSKVALVKSDNKLLVKTTDFYVSYDGEIESQNIDFDFACVDIKDLIDALKVYDSEQINIFLDSEILNFIVSDGENSSEITLYHATLEDITMINDIKERTLIDKEIVLTKDIIDCIDTNNPKYELDGLLINAKDGYMASTDTRRLAYKKIEPLSDSIEELIIPKKAIAGVSTIFSMAHITTNDGIFARLNTDLGTITTKLIVGKFPEVHRIIPKSCDINIKVNGFELQKELKKFKKDIAISIQNNKMVISSLDDGKTIKASCDCHYPSDIEFKMAIDSKYLLDSLTSNNIEIGINDNNLPFVVNNLDSGVKTIIMPIVLYRDVSYDIRAITSDLCNSSDTWHYAESKQAKNKRVDKDKIIRDLREDNAELRKKLQELTAKLLSK